MLSQKKEDPKIDLAKLYNFLFRDKGMLDLSKVPEDKQSDKITRHQQEIRDTFSWLLKDPLLSISFHYFLEDNKLDILKKVFYQDKKPPKEYVHLQIETPQKDVIQTKFDELNDLYQYFDSNEENKNQFLALFNICKFMADFYEKNNNLINDIAFLHAYKLMVYCGWNPKNRISNTESFINKFKSKLQTPIHDLLIYKLPVNQPKINLEVWRKLIQNNGFKALQIFQRATEIERSLNGPPKNLEEAENALANLTYKRKKEWPELAELCMQYFVEESIFNQCLDISKNQKSADQLPNIHVNGKDVDLAGYHLVKLPIDDPAAYLLGLITYCCQYVGGHSELCVIDGITRKHNGFYVLLKAEKGFENDSPFLEDGIHINYKKFNIIGQSYAWLSSWNNFTFDSWENKNPKSDDEKIPIFLKEFTRILHLQYPDIFRVTIGTDGKTPQSLKYADVSSPETPMEGFMYGDARKQHLIGSNDAYILKKQQALENDLYNATGIKVKISLVSLKQEQWIRELFINIKDLQNNFKDNNSFINLLKTCVKNLSLLEVIHIISQRSTINWQAKVIDIKHLNQSLDRQNFIYFILTFHKKNPDLIPLHLEEFFNFSISAGGWFYPANQGLNIIKPELLNSDTFNLLCEELLSPCELCIVLNRLHEADARFLEKENLKQLLSNYSIYKLSNYANALIIINKINPQFLTNDLKNWLLEIENKLEGCSLNFAKIFVILDKYTPKILQNDTWKLLQTKNEYFAKIFHGLSQLTEINANIISEEIINFYLNIEPKYLVKFTKALIRLAKVDNELLKNKDLFNLIIANFKNTTKLSKAIVNIRLNAPELLKNTDVLNALVNEPKIANNLSELIVTMYVYNKNVTAILQDINKIKDRDTIAESIRKLRKYPELFTETNINIVFHDELLANHYVNLLIALYEIDSNLLHDSELMEFIHKNKSNMRFMYLGLCQLDSTCKKLITTKLLNEFISYRQYASPLGSLYRLLHAHIDLSHHDKFNELVKKDPEYMMKLNHQLSFIPKLINKQLVEYLISLKDQIDRMGWLLELLHSINPEFINDYEFINDISKYKNSIGIDMLKLLIEDIQKLKQKPLHVKLFPNFENKDFIYRFLTSTTMHYELKNAIVQLYAINPKLIDANIFTLLCKHDFPFNQFERLLNSLKPITNIDVNLIKLLISGLNLINTKEKFSFSIQSFSSLFHPSTDTGMKNNLFYSLQAFFEKYQNIFSNDEILNYLQQSGVNLFILTNALYQLENPIENLNLAKLKLIIEAKCPEKVAELLVYLEDHNLDSLENNTKACALLEEGTNREEVIKTLSQNSQPNLRIKK